MAALPNHLEERAAESLETAEQQAIGVLAAELSGHLSLTEKAFNLIGRVVSSLPQLTIAEISQSRKVATALLVRLSNDLRSAALVPCRGYALHALSLVASMYETTFAIAAIGADDSMADQWITHDDPTQSGNRHVNSHGMDSPNQVFPTSTLRRMWNIECTGSFAWPST
jgi:hypothetical protein